MQTKSEMINRIAELAKENAELKENIEDLSKDLKVQNEIIGKLEAENERLKNLLTNIKDECSDKLTQEFDITDVTKRILNILFDTLKRLEQENAELKVLVSQRDASVTAQTGIILELKAENEQLKALCDTYKTCYRAKHNDIDGKLFKYRQTLQEIRTIAEQLLEKGLEPQSVEHQLRLRGKRELASIVIDLITKAEGEWK
jgi:predicted nuclease with TOPRIM domain